jgi:type I restriction enzyme, S subunit
MPDRTVSFSELASESLIEVGAGRPRSVLDQYPSLPILRVADVLDGRIESHSQGWVPDGHRKVMGSKISKPGDVVLTAKGTVGRVALMPPDGPDFAYSPQLCYFRPAAGGPLRSKYLYYWFKSTQFWNQADALKGQTDMADYLSLSDIQALEIKIPFLDRQDGIIEVLGSLDDKIALNGRIAETSREFAVCIGQRLFLSASGEEVFLGDCTDIVKGLSYRSSDLDNGTNGLVSLKCVGRDGDFQPRGVKLYGGGYKQSQVVNDGDIVVAQTDLTQRVEVIGRPVRVLNLGGFSKLIASLDLTVVRPRGPLSREVLLSLLSTEKFREHALSYCNGTTVVHLSSKALPEFKFIMPELDAAKSATAEMAPLLARSDQARHETQTLAQLRDALLPRLMSGAIRVRDAEKVVEDVT